MKKNNFFAMFIASVFIIAMTSCSEDLDYKKACAEKDWPKAYAIVDILSEKEQKLQVDYETLWYENDEKREARSKYNNAHENYINALRYVVLQESMVVLEESGEGGLMRIVGIAKEHNAESWLFSELADVAQKIGDTDLEEKIKRINNSSTSETGEDYNDYDDIVRKSKEDYDEIVRKSKEQYDDMVRNSKEKLKKMSVEDRIK